MTCTIALFNFNFASVMVAHPVGCITSGTSHWINPLGDGRRHLTLMGFLFDGLSLIRAVLLSGTVAYPIQGALLLNHVNGFSKDLLPDMSQSYTIRILQMKDKMVRIRSKFSLGGRGFRLASADRYQAVS